MTTLLLLPIAVNLASNTIPEWSQRWLWLSWPAVLLLTGAVILVDRQGRPWRRGRVGETGTHIVDETGLDAACDALRVAVDAQWAEEAAMRGLHRAGRLRVRWTTAVGSLAADPAGVLGDESLAGRPFRLRAHGEVRDLAASFRRLPNRQLVVLGAPGSGKTVLALLLTRALVAAARPGEPVPVLFSLASWRPDAEHLRSWLARRLKEEYLFLDNDEQYGLAAAERLVTAGRILPILDGLDELPVALHATAVQALDLGSAERPLVVTSRFEQYRAAASGHLLSRAMVILLQPLSLDDIEPFLSATAPERARWERVLAELRETPNAPLAEVFTSALMVALARSVYSGPETDSRELLDTVRFPDSGSVESHLLDGFAAAAYAMPRTGVPTPRTSLAAQDRDAAYRWLAFLARSGHQFAWWQLYLSLSRWGFTTLAMLSCAALAGPVVGLLAGVVFGHRFFAISGLSVALGVGVGAALVARSRQRLSPSRVQWRIRGRGTEIRQTVVTALGAGLVGGVLFGVVFWLVARDLNALLLGLVAGLVAGVASGLGVGLVTALQVPIEQAQVVSPRALLRTDRAHAILQACLAGLTSATVSGLAAALLARPQARVGVTIVAGAGVGFATILVVMCNSAWGRWQLSRAWLAITGKVPWLLIEFLEDSHSRGILRQTGGFYEFRHLKLQERLAAYHEPASHADSALSPQ